MGSIFAWMSDFASENYALVDKANLYSTIIAAVLTAIAGLLYMLLDDEEKDSYTQFRTIWVFFQSIATALLSNLARLITEESGMLAFCYWFIPCIIIAFIINLVLNIVGISVYLFEKDYKWTSIISLVGDIAFVIYAVTQLLIVTQGLA